MGRFELIPEVLAIVRKSKDPKAAYSKLLALCGEEEHSPLWVKLESIDVSRDIEAAADWLRCHLGDDGRTGTTGVYLGLDTLNMDDGNGHNVEIGGSEKADPDGLDLDWAFDNSWYGESHLIRGLHEMHVHYLEPEEEDVREFADYMLFLGYSGIILAAAIERLDPRVRSGSKGRLYCWGFHDGDLFPLCFAKGDRFQRLAIHEDSPPA